MQLELAADAPAEVAEVVKQAVAQTMQESGQAMSCAVELDEKLAV